MTVTGRSGSGVRGYLVTGSEGQRMAHWITTCPYANWLEVRGETAHVMVFDEQREYFLGSARAAGVTVQETDGSGGNETYVLLAGGEGAGWSSPAQAKNGVRSAAP